MWEPSISHRIWLPTVSRVANNNTRGLLPSPLSIPATAGNNMTTFKDAMKRLQIVYNECNPQSKENRNTGKGQDEFVSLKKQLHQDVKLVKIV